MIGLQKKYHYLIPEITIKPNKYTELVLLKILLLDKKTIWHC